MFDTIVWATDGSDAADRAMPYARELAIRHEARLIVVHVAETFSAHMAAGMPVRADEPDMRAKVERQGAELAAADIDTELKILSGHAPHAAHSIADAAREAGADLIIAGTRGHTPMAGLVVGSVTHRLLQLAPCPVLAIPSEHVRPAGQAAQVAAATA
jgi:nucleotide-binding universal stress UspA family protein